MIYTARLAIALKEAAATHAAAHHGSVHWLQDGERRRVHDAGGPVGPVPDYARALAEATGTSDDLIEERVAARIDLQQQTIERRPVPVTLIAVMDEAVLRRRVATEGTQHKQLLHLAEQSRRKHIGIQVVPESRGVNAGHVGAFTIASLDDADVMLMGAIEDVTTDSRAAIRAGLAIFDRVRLDALSGPESLELILKAADECKP